MMSGTQFRSNLICRVDGWIDFPSEPFLRARQRFHDFRKRCLANHEEVDVAGGTQLTAGRRPENEGHEHTFAERCQRLTDHVGETRGLCEQSPQLRKDRRLALGLEIYLSTLDAPAYKPGSGQLREFALNGSDRGTGMAHDLSEIVRFVRVT
jgi:hypothetical protein